ncbi:Cation efflux system protein CusB precursor [Anaerohalosphaera lusitana]|uniref:Cation efflux system protein CusB n=1 Tax=Anaerohalosphaera lusitana TaxID=1936003 RepID=A0A1U9NNF9_9BACT|nr:efflux RND transporter periplasmic adaptor subunit [Anaerohalosphaera lusitana]AQT69482.1 Cation efflux system protein CusB precursor [Anaerohalosphaera lusitana]
MKVKRVVINSSKVLGIILLLGFVFVLGYLAKPIDQTHADHAAAEDTAEEQVQWTCSMHPQILQDEPGDCPICGMDLIPLESGEDGGAPRQISFSEAAVKLMDVETSVVQRKFVEAEIDMVGKIDYDETRVKNIAAWVPGRLDRLFVDYTGIDVRKGDHMVKLYSPELLADQQALLSAIKSANKLKSDGSEMASKLANNNIAAARERLRLLGLTNHQIEEIEKAGEPSEHITIYAPIGGVVIHKNATEGMYVETGTKIYTIADLSQVWVKLDAYESDMMWIRYGQTVDFTSEAYPGEVFTGKIAFIDPILNEETRTVKLRVNVQNPGRKLKPGMFVRATVTPKVSMGGQVMDPSMAGKWICPMHPSIVKEAAGDCDICGMDLVETGSMGYMEIAEGEQQAPLVIPETSVLVTGKRAVVYLKLPGEDKPTFEGREIVLGPKAGEYYIVQSGLEAGDEIVTSGNFKIDSALQIQAKPSMMSPDDDDPDSKDGAKLEVESDGEQIVCPVMGGKINKDIFVEYKGKKVYFCCAGCPEEFQKNPEKYLDKLPQFSEEDTEAEDSATEQTICPVMGGKINKDIFVEYKGKKVYFCCAGCPEEFQKNPEKYIDKLPQFSGGEE